MSYLLNVLRHHVTGAIARGEAVAIEAHDAYRPTHYVAWYAADGRRVAWCDFETATEAHAAYAAPRADAASVCFGALSADGGFEPFIVRALSPDAPFVP